MSVTETEIQGTCAAGYEPVRDAFAENFAVRNEIGASVAVLADGEPVVNLWAGWADPAGTRPWQADTLTNVWSTTKAMTSLCAHILMDRVGLDPDAPVASYWPEFAASGKGEIPLRWVMSHRSGLSGLTVPVTARDLEDWEKMTALLAVQEPLWEPGTVSGYHAITFGFLVGEVVRRVTGRRLGAFFAQEVAGPLGADFHIGLPAEHDHRVAPGLAPPSSPSGDWEARAPGASASGASASGASASGASASGASASGASASGASASGASASGASAPPAAVIKLSDGNGVAWRRAEIPSASGFGNARSVAAVQSVLACGGTARGVRLLSPAGCERAREEQYRGVDHILGASMRYGMGYGLSDRSCFWGGWGGSMVMVDLDRRMAVSYVMNQMLDQDGLGDYRALGIILAAYEGLG
jgi:CubicO group peptidase (beta-lactamase class C family)